MDLEGLVGPDVLQDGVRAKLRLGRAAEGVVTELHGKYYEQNYRGNLYIAAQAATGLAISIFSAAVQNASWREIALPALLSPPSDACCHRV